MPSFFDPGHGLFSSVEEWVVALVAFVLLTAVGAITEYLGDAKGLTVAGAAIGYVVALLLWAPPFVATEWHYAMLVAVPVILVVYLYRRRE